MKNWRIVFVSVLILPGLLTIGQAQSEEQVCLPQFVDGTFGPFSWRTTVVLQNQQQTQAQVRLHFYDNNGQPMNGLMLRERLGKGQQGMVGPNGQFDARLLSGQAMRSYRSEGGGPFQAGYCIVESANRVRAHAMIQLFDAQGSLVSETGIIPGAQFRFGSFFADQTEDKGVGLALANSSQTQTAACTIQLFEEETEDLLGETDVQLGPGSQTAQFLFELFPGLLTGEVGFVRISCDKPVCALALQLRGLEMLQIPVFVEDN